MQAVILAAGKSSRFYPYNQHLEHKSLVVMMGKTLLEHTLDSLVASGIEKSIIIIGKNSSIPQILSHRKDIALTFVEQPEPCGMGDALLHAKDLLEETFFLLGAYHMDIDEFVSDMHALHGEDAGVVLVKKDEVLDRYGNVALEGNKVVEIIEKPEKATSHSLRIIAMYLLTKKFVDVLEGIPSEEYHFEKALALCATKGNILALETDKATVTLKYAWDLLGIKEYLLNRLHASMLSPKATIAGDAMLSGNVVIEDDAVVMEGACIKGPAYIGRGATVGNRAIVRNGVILEEKSVIGSQMEIKNTFIMSHTTTHAGFIGDSIVGSNTKIAAGIITANARLDRQPVAAFVKEEKVNTGIRHLGAIIGSDDNIGIRVSTMPGVVVGNNVVVGPSTTIMKNIASNKKYYTKFQEITEENRDEK